MTYLFTLRARMNRVACMGFAFLLFASFAGFFPNEASAIEEAQEHQHVIEGKKYFDQNGNGQRDPGIEEDLAGWEITLEGPSGFSQTTTTGPEGFFSFTGLEPGTYILCETMQDGWEQTQPGNESGCHTIEIGTESAWRNFGNTEVEQDECIPDPENDLTGDIHEGLGSANVVNASSDCSYGVGLAVYEIDEHNKQRLFDYELADISPAMQLDLQVDLPDCQYQIDLFYGELIHDFENGTNTYGERLLDTEKDSDGPVCNIEGTTIQGKKYNDANENGTRDEEEQDLQGWEMTISGPNSFSATTTTGPEGMYSFTGLEPGTYQVCETLQSGWVQTQPATETGCHTIQVAADDVMLWRNFGNVQEEIDDEEENDNGGGGSSSLLPALRIDKNANQAFANPGNVVKYTIEVRNIGPITATNVVLTDTLPAGFTYVTDGTNTKTWTLGNMSTNAQQQVAYQVQIGQNVTPGQYTNTATVRANNHNPLSDQATLEVRIPQVAGEQAFPELVISKTADKAVVQRGESIQFTITVQNTGDAPAVDVTIMDELPAGFESDLGEILLWSAGTLATGGIWTESFDVTISNDAAFATHENIATASAENHPEVNDSAFVLVRDGGVPPRNELPNTSIGDSLPFAWIGGALSLLAGSFALGLLMGRRKQIVSKATIAFAIGGILGVVGTAGYSLWPLLSYEASSVRPTVVEAAEEQTGEAIIPQENLLVIPEIGVRIPIVEGETEEALLRGAWRLPETSTPDQGSNTVIGAHRFRYLPPYEETFYDLDKLEPGAQFTIYWEGEKYLYRVSDTRQIEPTDIEVLNPTESPIVTLFTCAPLFSDEKRLVVIGELMKE